MALEVLLVVGLAVVAAAIFCGLSWMMSALSGWRDLAHRFRYHGKFRGEMYRFRDWGSSPWPLSRDVSGFGTLNAGMNEEGLYLVPIIPVRLFHPPLLIPWGEIEAVPQGKFFFRYRVVFRSVPGVALYVGDWFYGAARYLQGLKSPEEHIFDISR